VIRAEVSTVHSWVVAAENATNAPTQRLISIMLSDRRFARQWSWLKPVADNSDSAEILLFLTTSLRERLGP
jgi:hypothetical protein